MNQSKMMAHEVSIGEWLKPLNNLKLTTDSRIEKTAEKARIIEDKAIRKTRIPMLKLPKSPGASLFGKSSRFSKLKHSKSEIQVVEKKVRQLWPPESEMKKTITNQDEVDCMLIDAIKAKLALLDEM